MQQARQTAIENMRTATLEDCVREVKAMGDMSLVNLISQKDLGVAVICQITPQGSIVAWKRGDTPTGEVHQVPLPQWVQQNYEVLRRPRFRNGRPLRAGNGRHSQNNGQRPGYQPYWKVSVICLSNTANKHFGRKTPSVNLFLNVFRFTVNMIF